MKWFSFSLYSSCWISHQSFRSTKSLGTTPANRNTPSFSLTNAAWRTFTLTEFPSSPSARPLLPCTSVWQPVPTVATSRCGLSNSSANAFAEAPGPAVAAQELSALSGLMGRKKSQAALQNRSHFTGAFEAGEKQGWVVADARFSVRRQRDPH